MPDPSPWGPFCAGLEWSERKARFRVLHVAVRLVCGPRGRDTAVAIVAAMISGGDEEAVSQAREAFDALAPLDRRRILSSIMVDL